VFPILASSTHPTTTTPHPARLSTFLSLVVTIRNGSRKTVCKIRTNDSVGFKSVSVPQAISG
jgi:hypothetical protein